MRLEAGEDFFQVGDFAIDTMQSPQQYQSLFLLGLGHVHFLLLG